jgi:hypothetical protein
MKLETITVIKYAGMIYAGIMACWLSYAWWEIMYFIGQDGFMVSVVDDLMTVTDTVIWAFGNSIKAAISLEWPFYVCFFGLLGLLSYPPKR